MFSENSTMRDVLEYPEPISLRFTDRDTQKKQQAETVLYKESNKMIKNKQKGRVYFKIKVIGQVASFIQKLKASAVLNKPNFKKSELAYIHVDDGDKHQAEVAIKYENKFILFCQIWSYLIYSIIMWKASTELVIGTFQNHKIIEILGLFTCIVFGMLSINSQIRNEKLALIRDKCIIRERYLKHDLIPDIFLIAGLLLQLTHLDSQYDEAFYFSRISILFLIFRIGDIFKKIETKIAISRKSEAIMTILKLFIKMIYALHSISLLLLLLPMAKSLNQNRVTWVEKSGFIGIPNYQLYIHAWYWSCTIISTVGFGDITPGNVIQSGIMSILEIFSAIFFGFFLNYIGSVLNIFGEEKTNYQSEIRRLNSYMKKLYIPDELRDQARSYLFNKYKTLQLYNKKEEDQINQKITEKLKDKLLKDNNLTIIKKSIFQKEFTDQFLQEIAMDFQKKIFHSQSFLFEEKDKNLNLWIIDEGTVAEIPTKNLTSKPLSIFNKEQNTIGWYNFVSGQLFHTFGLINNFIICYQLTRSKFLRVLKKFPKDFYNFYEKKQYFLEKNKKYDNTCLGCGKMSHNVVNCSRIHYIPKKISFILDCQKKKAQKSKENQRKFTQRRRTMKFWKTSDLKREEIKRNQNKNLMSKSDGFFATSVQQFFSQRIEEVSELRQSRDGGTDNAIVSEKNVQVSLYDIESTPYLSDQSSDCLQKQYLVSSASIMVNRRVKYEEADFALTKSNDHFRPDHNVERTLKKFIKILQKKIP